MELPPLEHPQKYVGLYVIDFGGDDGCAVGYTANEAALLLESERFAKAKVYKIHRAWPDGRLELAGVSRTKFLSESGMFFHYSHADYAHKDFSLVKSQAEQIAPPCRVKLHLAENQDAGLLLGLIYPAEYEDEMGRWAQTLGLRGQGPVDAGQSQVQRYYQHRHVLQASEQLWPAASAARNFETLLNAVGQTLQR